MTDMGTVIGDAFNSIVNALVSFVVGIINAMLAPIKSILAGFGFGVAGTGVFAPIVLVLMVGGAVYLMWLLFFARKYLPS